jgi:hypothetical protein
LFQRTGALILAFFAIWLAGSSQAKADDCMSAKACSDAAIWQQAVVGDLSNKAAWFRATSRQNFIDAKQWGDKATYAFYAGNATAAAWYKGIADDYARKSVADSKAADSYAAQAQSYWNASQESLARSEFFGAGSDYEIASANGRKCEHTVHHPSDPDAFGSGKPNSYGCEYWNTWVRACDRDVDGHRVRVQWVGGLDRAGGLVDPEGSWYTDWAPSQGCVDDGTPAYSAPLIKLRVCVEQEGCSPWRRATG